MIYNWLFTGPWLARFIKNLLAIAALIVFMISVVAASIWLDGVLGHKYYGLATVLGIFIIAAAACMAAID